MEYLYRLRCGKYGYNSFNLGSNSCNKSPSISCASFTSREDSEINISPIVVPYRSTLLPFFVDGNCVDGNWSPTVNTSSTKGCESRRQATRFASRNYATYNDEYDIKSGVWSGLFKCLHIPYFSNIIPQSFDDFGCVCNLTWNRGISKSSMRIQYSGFLHIK